MGNTKGTPRASIGMGQEETSPNIWTGDTITSVPHHLMSQVKSSSFLDFVAFYFTKTHILLFNVDKEASTLGEGLCPYTVPRLAAILLCPPNYGDRSTTMGNAYPIYYLGPGAYQREYK